MYKEEETLLFPISFPLNKLKYWIKKKNRKDLYKIDSMNQIVGKILFFELVTCP